MSTGRSLARRWGYPVAGAAVVAVLLGANLSGVDLTGRRTPTAPLSGPPPSGATGGAGPDDHFEACRTGAPSWQVTAVPLRVFTGVTAVSVAAGVSPTLPATVAASTVLRASVTGADPRAGVATPSQVLSEVAARVRVALAGPASTTPTADRLVRLPTGRMDQPRRYVAWTGRTSWSGRWSVRWCSDGFWHAAGGEWTSFSIPGLEGAVLCRLGEQDLAVPDLDDTWTTQACRHA